MNGRRAAVLGSPVAHSKSPQLHLAAYRALGLTDWTYDRIECTADELPSLVGGFGLEWVGVSVTMPGKFAAIPVLLDAIYDPWPTPLAAAVAAAGGEVISGTQMLLHQAFSQVEQFTGRPAPRAQMAAALN